MSKIERIKTDVLHLAYEDTGPQKGSPVFLLHGWPDSPRTWDGVLEPLHAAGYRTIVPYVRGYGPTKFRTHLLGRNPRHTGQEVSYAQDIIDLADALGIRTFDFVGHDWGARAGYALAAVFSRRLRSLTAISVPFEPGGGATPKLPQSRAFWYQWYLCSHPGAKDFASDPERFGKMMWDTWSPKGWYSQGEFAEAAKSWGSDDFIDVVIHAYRVRWHHAEPDPKYAQLDARLKSTLTLDVPTLLIHGMEDMCELAETTDGAGKYFTGGYRRALIDDAGHFVSREAPDETAKEILKHLEATRGER